MNLSLALFPVTVAPRRHPQNISAGSCFPSVSGLAEMVWTLPLGHCEGPLALKARTGSIESFKPSILVPLSVS